MYKRRLERAEGKLVCSRLLSCEVEKGFLLVHASFFFNPPPHKNFLFQKKLQEMVDDARNKKQTTITVSCEQFLLIHCTLSVDRQIDRVRFNFLAACFRKQSGLSYSPWRRCRCSFGHWPRPQTLPTLLSTVFRAALTLTQRPCLFARWRM